MPRAPFTRFDNLTQFVHKTLGVISRCGKGMTLSMRHILLVVGIALSFIGVVATGIVTYRAAHYAYWYFREYSELRLQPVYPDHFAAANAELRKVRKSDERPLLVMFGDSRVAQWSPEPLGETHLIANRGIGAETLSQMRYRFDNDVLSLEPDLLIIQAGVNDVVAASHCRRCSVEPIEHVTTEIGLLVTEAQAAGVRTVVTTIFPTYPSRGLRKLIIPETVQQQIEAINHQLISQSDADIVIDSTVYLSDVDGRIQERFASDALHVNEDAYRQLNAAITQALEKR